MAGRSINVTLLSSFVGDGFINAQKQLKALGDRTDDLAKTAIKNAARFAVAFGANAVKNFGVEAITQARDLERSMMALDTVFGSLSPRIEEFSKSAVSMGLSQAEAAKASTFLGSVLKQSGFSIEETAVQTERLVKLAADLSTTYGYDVQEALMGMTALFRGEYDPIEKFGVAMKQSEINSELAARGMDKLEGSQRRLAEQQIRLELLYQRSTDAQGAFARGTGTLYVEQEKLEATINNMMQTAGTPLIAMLADLAAQMTPIVEEITPAIVEAVGNLSPIIESLDGNMEQFKEAIVNAADAIADIIGILSSLVGFYIEYNEIINILILSFGTFKIVGGIMAGVMTTLAATTGAAAAAQGTLNAAILANPYALAIAAVAGLIALIIQLSGLVYEWAQGTTTEFENVRKEIIANEDAFTTMATNGSVAYRGILGDAVEFKGEVIESREEVEKLNNYFNGFTADEIINNATIKMNYFANGIAKANAEMRRMMEYAGIDVPKVEVETETTTTGTAAKDAVKDFYAKIEDEIAKQNAKLTLQDLGLSEKLIDSVLGSGEDWEKIFNDIKKGGKAAAESLQADFNKTAAGIEELAAIAKQRAEELEKYQQGIIDTQMALYERLRQKYEENKAAIEELMGSVSEAFTTFKQANMATEEMGKLEQSIVSLTGSLTDLIAAQDKSLLSDKNKKKLQDYLNTSSAAMREVARQRQALEEKISGAKSLMQTVVDSIMGSVNITQFKGSSDSIIKQLRRQVEAQTKFQEDIKKLRASGLSDEALKQIQDAGVQAGGATAKALLKGGQGAIDEVNSLYAQLGAVATSAGEAEASAMYGAGVDMANGLMAGLEAQNDALTAMAVSMAAKFEATFNKALNQGIRRVSEPDMAAWQAYATQLAQAMTAANATLAPGEGYQYNGLTGGYVNGVYLPPQPAAQTTGGNITVNLNAGLGVNGAEVGRQIVEEIKKYERRNGNVFVPAVM